MKLGMRIKLYREKSGMTASELASVVGVTKNNIYQIERGVHDPSTELFLALINALNIEPEDLLQDRMALAAIDVFERTYSEIISTALPENVRRCKQILTAAADIWIQGESN